MSEPLLVVKDLHTSFLSDAGEIRAVEGVDLSIRPGETLGLVGESGCGKSVTSLSIMNLFKDTTGSIVDGSIRFKGRELVGLSEDQLQGLRGNDIAMIFQEPMTSLNPVWRIGEQIEEAVRLHLRYPHQKARLRVMEMLNMVGIPRAEEIYHDYPHQLSGGMRQRVMIALAMSCNPQLLIADEPTTALDVTIQAQILALMRQLRERHRMATMLITHDLAIVAQMCDRVTVMYAGRVVEVGDVFRIFDDPHHPYTQGLYHSLPRLDEAVHRLDSIQGVVPNPQNLPPGCKFAPRCSRVMERCWQAEPPFFEIEVGHGCRCWLYGG